MSELLQFSLLDMTPYDQQSWFNLLADYHQAIWPMQLLTPLLILAMLLLLFMPTSLLTKLPAKLRSVINPAAMHANNHRPVQMVIALLGLSWLWCGAVFHMQYFANLNWAAPWFGWVFLLQGGLLLLAAILMKTATWASLSSLRGWLAIGLLAVGLLVYPLSGFIEGRTFTQIEWFPLLPAPVTLVSFALIILLKSRWRHALVIIPLLWAIVSAAFATTLGLLEFYFMAGAIVLWLLHFAMA